MEKIPLRIGQKINDYEVSESNLGKGAEGITYKVKQGDSEYIMKEFYPEGLVNNRDAGRLIYTHDKTLEERKNNFLKEFAILKCLNTNKATKTIKPFIPEVQGNLIEANDTYYFTTSFYDGKALSTVVAKLADYLHYISGICKVLHQLHEEEVLHLDVKPDNIIIEEGSGSIRSNWIRLIDFGNAHATLAFCPNVRSSYFSHSDGFSAPELYTEGGAVPTKLSDIYSVGATLYYLLSGRKSLLPGNVRLKMHLIGQGQQDEAEISQNLENKVVSASVISLILKAVQVLPQERHRSISELELEIADINKEGITVWEPVDQLNPDNSSTQPPQSQSLRHNGRRRIALWLLVLLTGVSIAVWYSRPDPNAGLVLVETGSVRIVGKKRESVKNDFYIMNHEVTNQEYCTFLNKEKKTEEEVKNKWLILGPYCKIIFKDGKFKIKHGKSGSFEQHPVVCVTREGANAYATWKEMRLPTELEWRLAAANPGQDTLPISSADQAWFQPHSNGETNVVKTKSCNSRQIHDLFGNVAEIIDGDSSASPVMSMGGHFDDNLKSLSQNVPREVSVNEGNTGFRCVKIIKK